VSAKAGNINSDSNNEMDLLGKSDFQGIVTRTLRVGIQWVKRLAEMATWFRSYA
jgi:hypothetical protein